MNQGEAGGSKPGGERRAECGYTDENLRVSVKVTCRKSFLTASKFLRFEH